MNYGTINTDLRPSKSHKKYILYGLILFTQLLQIILLGVLIYLFAQFVIDANEIRNSIVNGMNNITTDMDTLANVAQAVAPCIEKICT